MFSSLTRDQESQKVRVFSPCGCAPRCPCPWQVKIERLIVHKRALCAVRTSLLSTYDPVASFRGAGIDRYRNGMPRVGAARSLFIFIPWAPPLRSVGRGAGRGLAECSIERHYTYRS